MNVGTIITIISLILIAVFLILIVFLLVRAKKLKLDTGVKRGKGEVVDSQKIREDWQAVLSHFNSSNESDWKLAIIEADKLIDNLLIQKGYKGESMAERMSLIKRKELKSIELLWEAHKLRNRIAHKPGFKLDYRQTQKAISYYEEALKDLREEL